jgi:hypothetical protein
VKYLFRKLIDDLLSTTACWQYTVRRVWKRDCGEICARAKMEMLGITRKANNMVFQSQYVQCFIANSLLQTYGYNLCYRHMVIIFATYIWL